MASEEEIPSSNEDARSDIEFLTSSWNRLDVLETISDESPTRDELRQSIPVSRVTLSRILSDLESRGWITKENHQYTATKAGSFLAEAVTGLLADVGTLNELGENVQWMRFDQFDFDLQCLQEADVITPSWDDFSAQTRALVEFVYDCSSIRGIGTGLDREFMQAVGDASMQGNLTVDLIFLPKVIDAITEEPELARLFSDLSDAPEATIYRYNGDEPVMELGINETKPPLDDTVFLCGEYEEGAPPGTIKSTNAKVREWAERYFEAKRAESHRLEAAVFTP